jgi:hypothetical protein
MARGFSGEVVRRVLKGELPESFDASSADDPD